MALVLKDRVKETTTSTGTGTITLAGASTGFQSFSVIGNGNATYYTIYDPVTGAWEVGIGTYTASGATLSRDTVLESSNSGSLVPFGAGVKDVFVTYPAERSVYLDTAGSAVTVLDIGTLGVSTANISSANITAGTISTTPTSSNDLVNKTYVDGIAAQGISYHTPVKYEVPNTTGNLNATYNQPGGPGVGVGATLTNAGTLAAFAPDGPTASPGDRILVYNQTNAFENGVYTVTTVGNGSTPWVLTRASDADTYGVKSPTSLGGGDAFFVTSGNTGAGETYVCNNASTITFGTTGITFAQIASAQVYSAGAGLTLSNLVFSITPVGTAGTYGGAASVPVFTTNAYGQITGVTPTSIAISGAAVSGNIAGSAGSVANALTAGTYLTATGTFDGSVARTFSVDATSANTASKVVARDASGNFSAGTITATLSGNATTATTATNIAGGAANQIHYQSGAGTTTFVTAPTTSSTYLGWNGSAFTWSAFATPNSLTFNNGGAGGASGSTFNGSSALTVSYNTVGAPSTTGTNATGTWGISISGNAATATSATSATTATNLAGGSAGTVPYQSAAGVTAMLAAGTSGQVLQSNGAAAPSWATLGNGTLTMAVSGTGLSGSASFTANQSGNSTFTVTSNATSANTASTIVARDASGNFSAGTITATLSGNSTTTSQRAFSGDISTGGQGRFTGWYTGNAATGIAAEIGMSGGQGYIFVYNRDTSTYGTLNISSSAANMQFSGGTINVSSGALQQGGNQVLHAGNYNSYALPLSGGTLSGTVYSTAASIIIGQQGSVTRGYLYNDSGGFGFLNSAGGWQAYVPYGETYFQMNGSARSPIFYDSNNTAYYVDPTGNSVLVNLGLGGVTPDLRLSISGDSHVSGILYMGGTAGSYSSWGSRTYTTSGVWYNNASSVEFNNFGYGSTWTFTLGSGNAISSGSMRAPIFYDSDNTGYYLDPASTSNINAITVVNTGDGGFQMGGSGNISIYGNELNAGSGGGTGTLYIGWRRTSTVQMNGSGGYTESSTSFRAPIFYDSNNTAYYVDPASTSLVNNVRAAGTYLRNAAGVGYLDGGYSAYENSGTTGAIYTIGGSYYPTSTSLNTMYGVGYAYSFTGGMSGSAWGFYVADSGVVRIYLDASSGIGYALNSFRAPLFYDQNNTSYYLDPAGTSYLTNAQLYSASGNVSLSVGRLGDAIYYNSILIYSGYNASTYTQGWSQDYEGCSYFFTGALKFNQWTSGTTFTERGRFDGSGNLTVNTSSRAPIFYDSNDTNYYVNPNSTSLIYALNVYGGGLYDTQTGFRLPLPGGAAYATSASSVAGAIKVRIPTAALGSNTMGGFDVEVYTYDGLSFTIRCGGYNYSDASKTWYNVFAYMVSGARPGLTVRFGWDGTSQCVWIGELGSSWSYPQVAVTNFVGGYSNYNAATWATGWTVSFETSSFYSVSQTATVYPLPYSTNNTSNLYAATLYDANNTGYYVDPSSGSLLYTLTLSGAGYFRPNNWIQLDGAYGLYTPSVNSAHFYPNNASSYGSWSISGSRNGWGGIYDSYGAVNYGMYDSGGNGGAYREASGRWYFYYNLSNDCMGIGTAGSSASYSLYLTKGVYAQSRIDATIYYDTNDTAYYVDPNGNSFLTVVSASRFYAGWDSGVSNSISCSNWFRSDGTTGWYNNSYTGGIYMIDTTWVRVYNSKAFYVENQIAATGNVTAYYSDERLKTKVGRIENALDKVRSLEGFLYVNNDLAKANGYTSDRVQVALSAQQVQRVQPEVVSLAPFDMHTDEFSGEITSKSGENYLTVDYERLVPLLVEAIKELSAKVDALH